MIKQLKKTKPTERGFDSVAFFRNVKEKLANKMQGMNAEERNEFMRKVIEGNVKLSL